MAECLGLFSSKVRQVFSEFFIFCKKTNLNEKSWPTSGVLFSRIQGNAGNQTELPLFFFTFFPTQVHGCELFGSDGRTTH